MDEGRLGFHVQTALEFDAAEAATRDALAAEGFGILTEIDVQQTLADKLGAKMERYKILGACNPPIAHDALEVWRGFGLLMPCNVVVRDAGDHRVVMAFDPLSISEVHDNAELLPIAERAQGALRRAMERVERASAVATG
ncbi:MAG: DUF302 domain-containing protein [Chloroflexi bacterium]|nr:DUF302 domain-containing protein [Chloroflexota bacterium]MDA1147622.1 DUF302 domain-containing protein [Chloroflexota bacterium]